MESSTSEKHFQFFSNSKCEYFPFHPTNDPENFNCLFCYCPLHALGDKCGGNFTYIAGGIKDCSGCLIPHRREGYDLYHRQVWRDQKTGAKNQLTGGKRYDKSNLV